MISYRDMTFCSVQGCPVSDCHRRQTDEVKTKAEEIGLPIAQADFSVNCQALKEFENMLAICASCTEHHADGL